MSAQTKPQTCPTCGSAGPRCCNSPYDASVKIRGLISKQLAYNASSFENGIWFCGDCPDAWHDYERRKGDRRGA